MIILLDTNALVWLLNSVDGGSLGKQSKKLIRNADAVYASSINVLEISIKAMLGKLETVENLPEVINSAGLKQLSFSMEHADELHTFPDLIKHDPFDRMLLAQAKAEGMFLLTSDKFLLSQDINYLLDARK